MRLNRWFPFHHFRNSTFFENIGVYSICENARKKGSTYPACLCLFRLRQSGRIRFLCFQFCVDSSILITKTQGIRFYMHDAIILNSVLTQWVSLISFMIATRRHKLRNVNKSFNFNSHTQSECYRHSRVDASVTDLAVKNNVDWQCSDNNTSPHLCFDTCRLSRKQMRAASGEAKHGNGQL